MLQAGREAWGLSAGQQDVSTAPEIDREDSQLPCEQPFNSEFSQPNTFCPPDMSQMALVAFFAWLVELAMPAGNGGVGM